MAKKQSQRETRMTLRREKVAQLLRQGHYNQFEIAKILLNCEGVYEYVKGEDGEKHLNKDWQRRLTNAQVMVSTDVRWVRARWREGIVKDYNEWVTRQIEVHLDRYRDIMAEWERSKQDEVMREREYERVEVEGEVEGEDGTIRRPKETATVLKKLKVRRRHKVGDPALAQQAREELRRVEVLLGLEQGTLDVTVRGDPNRPITHDHRHELHDPQAFLDLAANPERLDPGQVLERLVAYMRNPEPRRIEPQDGSGNT